MCTIKKLFFADLTILHHIVMYVSNIEMDIARLPFFLYNADAYVSEKDKFGNRRDKTIIVLYCEIHIKICYTY